MVVFIGGEFAISQGVPEFDFSVSSGGDNLSVIWGESNGVNFFGVSVEFSGAFSLFQVPKSEGFVPRGGDDELVVLGDGQVGNEVGVTGKGSVWISVGLGGFVHFLEEFPDDDFLVSGS